MQGEIRRYFLKRLAEEDLYIFRIIFKTFEDAVNFFIKLIDYNESSKKNVGRGSNTDTEIFSRLVVPTPKV